MKIAIVGIGVIGSAVLDTAQRRGFDITCVDPKLPDAVSLEAAINQSPDAIIVCLPTLSRPDGTCDVSILESAFVQLDGCSIPVISHSTAPWELYSYWATKIPNLVHVPEFVTAANAARQYASQHRVIIGGNMVSCRFVAPVIQKLIEPTIVRHVTIREAAFIKYLANSWLATKVVFMNQLYELAKAEGIDWHTIAQVSADDPRLGNTHWQVPGPDGQRGYGGMCFPKDVDALLAQSDLAGIGLSLLEETKKANNKLRKL
jgi:nucleotide sugar dehydrogenase